MVQNVTADRLAADLPGTILAADTLTFREIGPEQLVRRKSQRRCGPWFDKGSGRIGHTNALLAAQRQGWITTSMVISPALVLMASCRLNCR